MSEGSQDPGDPEIVLDPLTCGVIVPAERAAGVLGAAGRALICSPYTLTALAPAIGAIASRSRDFITVVALKICRMPSGKPTRSKNRGQAGRACIE